MNEVVAPPDAVSEVAELPPLTEEQSHFLIERVWRFFCSLRLMLANFALLFVAMVAGTFVNPQNDTLANIERAFKNRPAIAWAYRTFELYDLFHSWWFTLLLLSLALNLVACSLERLPRIYFLVRYPQLRLDEVRGLQLVAEGRKTPLDARAITEKLSKRGYRVVVTPSDDGGADLFAERGRYARFGVWVIHLSLLLVLLGGIVGRLSAFEGTADLQQNGGSTTSVVVRSPDGSAYRKPLGFVVVCDDFRLKEFSPGKAKALESDLRILSSEQGSEGLELARKTIGVNDPLKFGGLTIYQASYRQVDDGPRARITLIDKASGQPRQLLAGAGEPIDAADGLQYQVADYSDDFAGLGPAVQVLRAEAIPGATPDAPPATRMSSFWVFKSRPDFDRDNREDRFAFRFEKLDTLYATGLQIARDPSIPVVYTGCFGIFLGMGVAFYTSHKRLWARLAGGRLSLGGASHRDREAFANELHEITKDLETA